MIFLRPHRRYCLNRKGSPGWSPALRAAIAGLEPGVRVRSLVLLLWLAF